ncbi:MAG: hypothetical protein IJ752_08190 [Alphaproteobacteria bacterium]|nr:hypothetical protein [Alphaproteobacteria bacterium]
MQPGKFVLNFVMIFALLMFIVWAGTSFDNEMAFSWYAYTIVSVLSFFYAWTKSVNMNKIADDKPTGQGHRRHVVHHHLPEHVNHSHRPMP